ncbi:MAG: Serine/threonine-protein kinase PrkC [candidate division BRC1 bacterium ADurb.BinA364]|nr:MAG: Serine/threonine-protein kinase PrkC [candidate division BRC1 bacterium ADurb.BinA364]
MERQDVHIGQVVDGYAIEELIGRGGMGAVYRGMDLALRRPAAIKILPAEALEDEDLVRRFEREARLVAEINHPNIAQMYRVGRIGGVPYFAMEYIQGRSLHDLLKERGRLGGRACVDYLIQTARGLRAAAQRGIVHRDIKPANIMLDETGVIKIVDFGIAKAIRDDTFKTMTGIAMGTPRYMSPEQSRGGNVDQRSDIYSLGATFFHLVAGQPPFDGESAIQIAMRHLDTPPPSIKNLNPNVPERFANILYTMLEKDPAQRVQDYDQLLALLEGVYAAEGQPRLHSYRYVSPDQAAQKSAARAAKTRNWTLVALALALLAALPFAWRKSTERQPPAAKATGARYDELQKTDRSAMTQTLIELQQFQQQVDEQAD